MIRAGDSWSTRARKGVQVISEALGRARRWLVGRLAERTHSMKNTDGANRVGHAIARKVILVYLPIVALGCADAAPPGNSAAVEVETPALVDSAGVPVRQHFQAWVPAGRWTISAEAIVSIGVEDGDAAYLLNDVQGATILSNGSIVVGDGMSREIRFYDGSGAHLRTIGGRGGGPTEFQYLRFLGSVGDSVFAADPVLRKVIVLGPDGELVRTSRFPPQFGVPNPIGVLQGAVVSLERVEAERTVDPEGVARTPFLVRGSTWDAEVLFDLGPFPGSESANISSMSGVITFGRGLHVAVGHNRVIVGNDDAFRIRLYSGEGQLTSIVAVESEALPVGEGDFDAYMDDVLAEHKDKGFRRRVREAAMQMPQRETIPFFRDLAISTSGDLWVLTGDHPVQPNRTWLVFDLTGTMVAEASFLGRAELLHVRDDGVVLLHRDEQLVERVRVHRIGRDDVSADSGSS